MTLLGWILVAFLALNTMITTAMIGRPREPLTHGAAVFTLVFNVVLAIGILAEGTGHLH